MTFFNWQNQQVMQASQLSLLIVGLLELQKNVYGGPRKTATWTLFGESFGLVTLRLNLR